VADGVGVTASLVANDTKQMQAVEMIGRLAEGLQIQPFGFVAVSGPVAGGRPRQQRRQTSR
jgi:hypothetical protein